MADGSTIGLADAFDQPTRDDWLALVGKVLKGADFEKRLVSRTGDGIRIEPLYTNASASPSAFRDTGQWAISQRVDHPEPDAAARLALGDLEGGANALVLVPSGARSARGFGLACATVTELDRALAGVMLDLVELRIDPAPSGAATAAVVAALVESRRLNPSQLEIDFGLDAIGVLATSGRLPVSWNAAMRETSDSIKGLAARGFKGPFVTSDVRWVSESGGTEAQELAVAVAYAIAYARGLERNGIDPATALRSISFSVAVDADQFVGVAKLRALRRLAACISQACGAPPTQARIHAETAWRMMTRRDPWVNMLRATMAVTTAGLGGADTVTVLPHTLPIGLPDAFARRVARNIQLVLLEESNLWRVSDPAAGSGAIEALTSELAAKAWQLFQDIEREGGLVASLESGKLQQRITGARDQRLRDVATRKVPLTGTSEFPNLQELPVQVLDVDRVAAPQARMPEPNDPITIEPLPTTRLSEPFEALRDESDAYLAEKKHRPRIFLASLGAVIDHNQRSTWIQNLLASGGIEATGPGGYANAAEAATAFASSGLAVACIASSDAVYTEQAQATAQALKTAGARHVLLAGRPGELETAYRAAGVDEFISAGQDVVELLARLQNIIRS